MSQKKIADLTEVQSVDENLCYVPVDNGSATVKIKLKNLEESATESAESYAQAAAESATRASGYADAAALSSASASTYATNASESAQDAELSAGSASDSADAAAVSASNAASSASNVAAIVTDVSQQAAVALASAEEAKSWAVGGTDTRAGEDTDNAKWYSIQAGASATNAAASESNAATSEANAAASESNAATSETNASSSETNAATSATNAASSETNAGASATAAALSEEKAALSRAAAATSSEDAEAWSVGTRNNVPVPSTDPAYNNNAKYWAEAAAGAAGGGVTSFNGRAGAVSSQAHDYSANQVDFNNADNGFTATNTQAAIEEVAGNLSDLDTSLASVAKSGSYNDLSNTPNLATVATSGSYADLSNTPTLGTAAAKNSTNTISSGSSDLIESGPVYSLKQTLTNQIANEIATRVKVSGHNIGKITKPSQTGLTGLDVTVNQDGSVKVNGTSTAAWSFIMNDAMLLKAGSYTLSSGIGANPNLYVQITNENQSANIANTANSAEKTFTLNVDTIVVYRLFYLSGQTFNNVVVKPMIRLATDESADYEPYSMTNREMTPYVQAISNSNLLDNPWFTVNQRGDTSYTGNGAYTVDRWLLKRTASAGTLSVIDGGITISASDGANKAVFICQYFEESFIKRLNGKAVTMSVLKGDGKILKGTIASFDYQTSVQFVNTSGIVLDYEAYNSKYDFRILNFTSNDISIRAIKLELGSVSTLAMDTAPNMATELLKCQRYFVRFGSNESVPAYTWNFGMAYEVNSSVAYYNATLPVQMRSTPSISYQGSWAIGSKALNNITVNSMINNIVKLICTTSQTFTVGKIELLENKEAGINYIDLSADL